MKKFTEPSREIPIAYETDVVVVGGGPGGIGAALSAARNGAKTILLEQNNACGGVGSYTLSNGFMGVDFRVLGGVFKEICTDLKKRGAIFIESYQHYQYDIEQYKRLLDEKLLEAGVKILYQAKGTNVIKEGNKAVGIVVECDEGRIGISAKIIIDCTGYASVSDRAGANILKYSDEMYMTAVFIRGIDFNKLLQDKHANEDWVEPHEAWETPKYRAGMIWWPWNLVGGAKYLEDARKRGDVTYDGRLGVCMFALPGTGRALLYVYMDSEGDSWKLEHRANAELRMRQQQWANFEFLKHNIPGFENASMDLTASHARTYPFHMEGDYILTGEDMFAGKAFEDSIAITSWMYDPPKGDRRVDVPIADIPYRCLYSKNIDNLMAAGTDISYDSVANWIMWGMPTCLLTGQAAGTAAAIAVKDGVTPREVDVKKLQNLLQKQGVTTSKKFVPKEINDEYDDYVKTKREEMKTKNFNSEVTYW